MMSLMTRGRDIAVLVKSSGMLTGLIYGLLANQFQQKKWIAGNCHGRALGFQLNYTCAQSSRLPSHVELLHSSGGVKLPSIC